MHDLATLVVGMKAAPRRRMQGRIRDGIDTLRAVAGVLQRKWRSKPKGEELRRHLEAVERTLAEPAVSALVEFLVRMQLVSDSMLLRDVLDAAETMLLPENQDGYFSIGPGLEIQELTAEEAAEIAALGPQHGSGDDCAICAVLARQRRDREMRASAAGN